MILFQQRLQYRLTIFYLIFHFLIIIIIYPIFITYLFIYCLHYLNYLKNQHLIFIFICLVNLLSTIVYLIQI